MGWFEKKMKRTLYKKMLLEKDIAMAINDGSVDRVVRIVPKHSKDIFENRLKAVRPDLLN
ncbi:hypothetical protein AAGG74_19030 [Bacillus mexicanus]|uniref:hypothetical protein n=1 Tax=Bacillus mexicanus TaxID=2834415 RepID=UPI003D1D69D6